jgi:tripartite-type tricarboxylate transporter receptor subunit TctC
MEVFMNLPITRLAVFALAISLTAVATTAAAQASKPVKILVGFPPGGGIDLIARTLQPALAEELKATVIVENKPGAGGVVAAQELMRATPDGTTILIANMGPFALAPNMAEKRPYDPLKDFTQIAQTTGAAYIAAIPSSHAANTLAEFIAWAKANPNTATFASGGSGSITHLNGELLNGLAGTKLVHVPYKGSAPAVTDLMAGTTHLLVDVAAVVLPNIKGGKLKAIYVTGKERNPLLPNVPTVKEAGFPGLETSGWQGVVAPAGVPADTVKKLSEAIGRALARPDVKAKFEASGSTVVFGSPAEFTELVKTENERWTKVIKAANIKLD